MILSGKEIERQIGGNIIIEPFDKSRLNPNSYNLTLAPELLVYENTVLDMKVPNPCRRIEIPESGLRRTGFIWGAPMNIRRQRALFPCWRAVPPPDGSACLSM